MLLLVSLALMFTSQEAYASGATLPAVSLPSMSHFASWFTSRHWGKLPVQQSGTAVGRSHRASAAATRAGQGVGHKPGKGRGELPTATPYARPYKVGASAGHAGQPGSGFNSRTSKRDAGKSTATSTYYRNADGTVTRKVSLSPVNYQAGKGDWQPIDTTVGKASDGRWQERANSLSVGFAPKAAGSDLVSFGVDGGHSLSYGLHGAADVAGTASGSTVSYRDVLPHTDLTVAPTPIGVKEAVVLDSAQAGNSWTFPLTLHGLTPTLDAATGAVDLKDSTGKLRETIPPAYAYDSKVNPRSGDPATTHDVSYRLAADPAGGTDLVVTLDRAWLTSPDRVFPVTVDPTVDDGWTTTYVETDNPGNHASEQTLKVGSYDSGTHEANSFINHWYTGIDGSGVTVTGAKLYLYDTWASICTAERFDVAQVTASWNPASTSTYPGPAHGASIGNATPSVPAACANTAANRSVGNWVAVTLSTSAIQGWVNGTTKDYGLAVYADTTDANHWKQFGSFNDPGYTPYLELTYTGNVAPQIKQQYPLNNASADTTTPELSAAATDDSTTALKYDFQVYNSAGTKVVDSGLVTSGDWTVPAGKLTWGQTYYWTVQAYDGSLYSPAPAWEALTVDVPQPAITSGLSQNDDDSDHGVDPSIGNYTTEDTDASISTAGPALEIDRNYNSRDPRWTGAFGAGWSSILDAKATEQDTPAGAVGSVVVTYPDGSEVGYGKNSDGSFTAPSGRFATFVAVSGGGYTLTDKNDTVYTFTHALGSGAYGITSVADADARTLQFSWTGNEITQMTSSVSQRALYLTWSTPSGAAAPHVASVYTGPVTGTDQSTDLTWTYGYTGDQLGQVCDPQDSGTHCTRYSYTSGSQYRTAALDLSPHSFWSLGESTGATTAASAVQANEGDDNATYNNVTLGQPGPLAGSSATAAGFDGSSSTVALPDSIANGTDSESVSLWFKTSVKGGVLFSYNSQPLDQTSLTGFYTPSLYVGSDGKLNAEFWYTGGISPIVSSASVADGAWHHVVLAAAGSSQTLYLDGAKVGSLSGQVSFSKGLTTTDQDYTYLGGGYLGGSWPDQSHSGSGTNTGYPSYFNGSIADVALYNSPLSAAQVGTLYQDGTHPASLLTTVTRPSGAVYANVSYDPTTETVSQLTDENGGVWKVAQPTVAGSSQTYRSSVLGSAPVGYWRFGDAAGSATATDEIRGGTGTYNAVTLGSSGPFSDATAGAFDGTSSYVQLPSSVSVGSGPASVEMWFKTTSGSTAGGVLFDQEKCALASSPVACGGYNPALYVGTDGKLYGKFWDANGSSKQIISTGAVNNGKWHYVVLAGSGSSQTLYLDGSAIGTTTGAMSATGTGYDYVGAGAVGGNWTKPPTDQLGHFSGSIAEVAYYRSQLSAEDVAGHYTAAKNSQGLLPVATVKVTDPGNAVWTYRYDVDNGDRLLSETDGTGATTSYGYDTGGFEHTVTDPDGDTVTTGHDVRGNTVSVTSCQNQAASVCSTEYFSYYPDDTSAQLTTPDPRNDLLLTSRDGRSASATDPTYETSYGYDAAGDQTAVTTPPVAGYPNGRTTSTTYSDGTSAYPATGGGNVPKGLPVKSMTPGGATSTVAYFSDGDVASTTDPNGLVDSYTYDNIGRVLTKTEVSDSYPNGLTTSYTYDRNSNVVSETDPAVTDRVTGAVHTPKTTTVYDADGDTLSQTVADLTGGDAPRTESSTYNQYDQVATSTDANGNAGAADGATTTDTYDAFGNVVKEVDQQGTTTQYTFDDNGNLLTQGVWSVGDPTNPGTATFVTEQSRAYDPAGRLASVTDAMGNTTAYTYTDDGLVATTTRTDAQGKNPYVLSADSYDAAGNMVKEVDDNGAHTTTYQVDAADRTTLTTDDPTGVDRQSRMSYTPDDLVSTEQDTDSSGYDRTTGYTYNSGGNETSETLTGDASGHPSGWWKLGQTSGSTVPDATGNGNTASATGVTWATGSDGTTSAQFAGTTGQQIATNGPVLDTTGSYTVSAWVDMSKLPTRNVTVVSQTGTNNSAFELMYNYAHNGAGTWAVTNASNDATGPAFPAAYSTGAAPTVGAWTHLVDVYNAATGAIDLYVNGALAGTGTDTTPWNASGPLTIGADKYNGAADDLLPGSVANVQAYPRALSASEVTGLYQKGRTGGTVGSNTQQTTTWSYDKRGLPLAETDPDGNTTNFTYDEAGNLAVETDPTVAVEAGGGAPVMERPVTTTGYNNYGEAVEQVDPNGDETVSSYDANGDKVSQTDPSYTPPGASAPVTATTTWTYDSAGNMVAESEPDGETSHSTYDQLGNLVQSEDPDGGKTHLSYDADGDQTQIVDANGATTQATYDDLGRQLTATTLERYPNPQALTTSYSYAASSTNPGGAELASTTTPAGVTTGYGYDGAGQMTSETDGAGNTTHYTYDFMGDQQKAVYPDGTSSETDYDAAQNPVVQKQFDATGNLQSSESSTYDPDGNELSSTDALGHTSTFTYDAAGDLSQEVQPVDAGDSITTSFGYDADGQQTRYTDGRGNSWHYTYNSWGLPETSTAPSTSQYSSAADSTTTYYYNGDGQLVSELQPGGVSQQLAYDGDGDLTQQSGSGASAATATRTFTYDSDGQMKTAATGAAGTVGQAGYQPATSESFGYDDRGDLLSASGSAGSSSFSYTADGLMASRTDAAGTSSYTYDKDDRLATLNDAATGKQLTYGYDSLSELTSIQYGSTGQTRTFGYNNQHELTSDTLKQGSTTLASIAYGYDADANLTSKTTTGVSGASANTYTYDWASRLTSWNNGSTTTQYAYDASGNRTRVGANVYTYDARDQLTSDGLNTYSYTADGTMSLDVSTSGSAAYTSDAYGQQVTAGGSSFSLDALGRTVGVTHGAGQAGAQSQALSFSGQDNLVASDGSHTYSYDPDGGVVGINAAGSPQSAGVLAMTDQHADVVADFTPGATTLAGSQSYDPLGSVVSAGGLAGQLGYQSGWTDSATGKVDMDARWYNPASGQFMNHDTASVSPTPDEAAANPFAYAADNPLGETDPSGHWGFSSIVHAVKHKISHTVSKAVHVVKKAAVKVVTVAKKVVKKVVKKAKRAVSKVVHKVSDVVHETVRAVRHVASHVVRRVKQVARRVVHVVHTVYTSAKRVVKKAVHKAVAVTKKAASKVASVAKKAASVTAKAVTAAAKTSATYLKNHAAAITSFVASTAVFMGCEAVTAGVGTIGCAAAAGAVGSLVDQGFKCADDGGSACSLGAFAGSALEGAVAGAAGGALGELGSGLLGKLAPKALDAIGGLFSAGADDATDTAAADAVDDVADDASEGDDGDGESCPIGQPHSFTGATPVLMADGTTKRIDEIKVGDKISDSVPGQKGTQSNTVTNVIVTHTDHDFADVTIAPVTTTQSTKTTKAATTSLKTRVLRKAALGLAASAAAIAALTGTTHHTTTDTQPTSYSTTSTTADAPSATSGGGTLHTTFHHPFYDETQAAFVQAEDLHPGDLLQTPTGQARVTALHLFHANTTTYDLTIGALHTYYVVAGDTPVLVHNCGVLDRDQGVAGAHPKDHLDLSDKQLKDRAETDPKTNVASTLSSDTAQGYIDEALGQYRQAINKWAAKASPGDMREFTARFGAPIGRAADSSGKVWDAKNLTMVIRRIGPGQQGHKGVWVIYTLKAF